MIGYIVPVKDNIDQQFYQARSIHHIPDNGYSNKKIMHQPIAILIIIIKIIHRQI